MTDFENFDFKKYNQEMEKEMFSFKERMKNYIDNLPTETTLRYMGVVSRIYNMYDEETVFKLLLEKLSLGVVQLDREELEKPIY